MPNHTLYDIIHLDCVNVFNDTSKRKDSEVYPDGFDPLRIVVGLNSTKKAAKEGRLERIFLGSDADMRLNLQIEEIANETKLPLDRSCTMAVLGALCGIEVRCAVCGIEKA